MSRQATNAPDTPTQILDIAELLVQVRGFNAFSYSDIATELKITRAALHYHFSGKSELGEAVITRYANRFSESLRKIESQITDAPDRLDAYVELYAVVLRENRMCLCGILAAEYQTLSAPMQDRVIQFFDENETWLTRVLELGQNEATLRFAGPAREVARTIISTLEGAMLVSRAFGDVQRFGAVADHVLSGLKQLLPESTSA